MQAVNKRKKTVMVVLTNVFGCLDSRAEFRSSQSGWKDQIQNTDEQGHPVENIKQCKDSFIHIHSRE